MYTKTFALSAIIRISLVGFQTLNIQFDNHINRVSPNTRVAYAHDNERDNVDEYGIKFRIFYFRKK